MLFRSTREAPMERQTTCLQYPVDALKVEADNNTSDLDNYLVEIERGKKTDVVICQGCAKKVSVCRNNTLQMGIYGQFTDHDSPCQKVLSLFCENCSKITAFHIQSQWFGLQHALKSYDNRDGFHQVTTFGDRFVLWVLNRIMYKYWDTEPGDIPFLSISPHDEARLIWNRGNAVGFYTMKTKGTSVHDYTSDTYALPVIDTIYVQKKYRRQGYGMKIMEDIVKVFPDMDVGFSYPVSSAMLSVQKKFLMLHPEHRDHMWEVTHTGGEGYQQNIWFKLRNIERKRQLESLSISAKAQL
ncbi:soluble lamin-associated protein of 75 kDa-like isoform X1 [Lingula anatina]|uniref:Soluble lamin-associated protein of 75 kDa-like isoform X1 n=1 Tax=Lingula anatina TaxID=7574 RepID=A0A1S3INS6_LINAN|nr:soluble lamin-associated protein of 75 kDa-like isoform X1 [Lingula anatina]|eukprot:XP_013399728.1 soluble lamin-associated protein of 75 kDa-like isoform X1 [Lingula anatina]